MLGLATVRSNVIVKNLNASTARGPRNKKQRLSETSDRISTHRNPRKGYSYHHESEADAREQLQVANAAVLDTF